MGYRISETPTCTRSGCGRRRLPRDHHAVEDSDLEGRFFSQIPDERLIRAIDALSVGHRAALALRLEGLEESGDRPHSQGPRRDGDVLALSCSAGKCRLSSTNTPSSWGTRTTRLRPCEISTGTSETAAGAFPGPRPSGSHPVAGEEPAGASPRCPALRKLPEPPQPQGR